ncbi:MAG: beta-galactosidase, partial [Thermoanaerobacterium sp.]|nr:beta-galactosidase [Thermoanaerobacterium sp.]
MNITYDAKSFLLDNKRIWIVAGEVHYFRHPADEWRQVLLRAKRAGLNAISTYVPWNFHETREGIFDFYGDKDLARYIDLIGEMGMYAILRPGPYICSEWDGGGIPAWLCAKPVRRFREDDPVYMDAVERWFDKLLPIISARQVTRGGPVILIQNENEYPGGWDESMRRYIKKINTIFKRHGIDVPILACNVHRATKTEVQINCTMDERDQFFDPDMILTYNSHVDVEPVYHLKSKQPNAPLFVTEFWCGQPVYWGKRIDYWPHHLDQARAAYEYASAGAQVCYYMFEGGTNFGFWGGNNIATSYASSYPVGEGGKLTEKYYVLRPFNLFSNYFGEYLADSVERTDKANIQYPDGIRLIVRECSKGSMAFISTADKRKEIPLTLASGKSVKVFLGEVAATVIPIGLEVFDNVIVDHSNLTLLARNEAKKVIILFGVAGTEGVISINGKEESLLVCRRKVLHKQIDGVNVIITDEEMARRCWIVDDSIVFGPDFVGEMDCNGSLELKISDGTPEVVYLDAQGHPVCCHFSYKEKIFKTPE